MTRFDTITLPVPFKLLLLLLLPATVQDAASENVQVTDRYRIELIVFKQKNPATAEFWPTDVTLTFPEDLIAFPESSESPERNQQIRLLPVKDLESVRNKLNAHRKYEVLVSRAWSQPLGIHDTTTPLHLSGGINLSGVNELDGSIHFTRGRYIHADIHLWLTDFVDGTTELTQIEADMIDEETRTWLWPMPPRSPLDQPDQIDLPENPAEAKNETRMPLPNKAMPDLLTEPVTPEASPAFYSVDIERIALLKQKQRLKTHRIHYIDHPLFGLVIKVRKETTEGN